MRKPFGKPGGFLNKKPPRYHHNGTALTENQQLKIERMKNKQKTQTGRILFLFEIAEIIKIPFDEPQYIRFLIIRFMLVHLVG